MTAFWLAIQFLTRVPVTLKVTPNDNQLGLSVLYYPLVGLLIGGLLWGFSLLAGHLPVAVQAALLLLLWVLITGGLHLDGLADCADAWAGGLGDKQRSLQIMKDPNVGAIAVVTLIIVLLLKWSCLQSVLLNKQWLVLLMTPMLGRCAILVLMLTTPYISPQGLGGGLTQNLPRHLTRIVVFSCISVGIYALGFAPLLVASLLLIWLRHLSLQHLTGVTGDVYGASVELVETAVLTGCITLI